MAFFWSEIINYTQSLGTLEFLGLVFGLLNVLFLIRQNILTWPTGLIYVFISLVVFWQYQLYGDFLLHIIFLALNLYGWWFWVNGPKNGKILPVTSLGFSSQIWLLCLSVVGTFFFGWFLSQAHHIWPEIEPASVPYWDATTSIFSITGIWLMAKKKIENWYYWLFVDILASGIYFYKGIHFYSLLYGVYILMAITGYFSWKKSTQHVALK